MQPETEGSIHVGSTIFVEIAIAIDIKSQLSALEMYISLLRFHREDG